MYLVLNSFVRSLDTSIKMFFNRSSNGFSSSSVLVYFENDLPSTLSSSGVSLTVFICENVSYDLI